MRLPSEPRLSRAVGDGVFLLQVGLPGDTRHCMVAESPAGLILFDPPHDAVEKLIAAFSANGWLFADLLAVLVTEASTHSVAGALRIGIRNRRCRILGPRWIDSPRQRRAVKRLLGEDAAGDQMKAALDRMEIVSPFEILGPGGRTIHVLPAGDDRSVVYQDAASGVAFAGSLPRMQADSSQDPSDATSSIRELVEALTARAVRLLVVPGINPLAPADLLVQLDSNAAPHDEPTLASAGGAPLAARKEES